MMSSQLSKTVRPRAWRMPMESLLPEHLSAASSSVSE
jgi:hypothetical protein